MSKTTNPSSTSKNPEVARILQAIDERQRRGEHPRIADYEPLAPEIRKELEDALQVLDILSEIKPGPEMLDQAIAAISPKMRRVIYLRHFEKLAWEAIARNLGEPAEELRRDYARCVKDLMARCQESQPMAQRLGG